MEFTNGIKALVVVGEKSKECTNSEQVYEFLTDNGIYTKLAEEAMGWVESTYVNGKSTAIFNKNFSISMK